MSLKYATELSCILQKSHLPKLFVNLAVCVRALISKFTSIFWLVETSTTENAIFHRVELCKFLWGNPCRAVEPFAYRTPSSRCIFHILLRRRSWRGVRLCRFCTLIFIVSETAIVSFHTLPVGLPLPTISLTSLFTLFYPLILDHGRLFQNFRLWRQNSSFVNSARYFFLPLSSIWWWVRFGFLLMNLHIVQFQHGLGFLRLSYS